MKDKDGFNYGFRDNEEMTNDEIFTEGTQLIRLRCSRELAQKLGAIDALRYGALSRASSNYFPRGAMMVICRDDYGTLMWPLDLGVFRR